MQQNKNFLRVFILLQTKKASSRKHYTTSFFCRACKACAFSQRTLLHCISFKRAVALHTKRVRFMCAASHSKLLIFLSKTRRRQAAARLLTGNKNCPWLLRQHGAAHLSILAEGYIGFANWEALKRNVEGQKMAKQGLLRLFGELAAKCHKHNFH